TQVSGRVRGGCGSRVVPLGWGGSGGIGGTAASSCLPTSGRTTPLASFVTITRHLLGILSIERRALSAASAGDRPWTRYFSFLATKSTTPLLICFWQLI